MRDAVRFSRGQVVESGRAALVLGYLAAPLLFLLLAVTHYEKAAGKALAAAALFAIAS